METGSSSDTVVRQRELTYEEVQAATKSFSPECFIGEGRYGSVYKGEIQESDKLELVAVRKLKHDGVYNTDIQSEFKNLTLLRHPNLVKVIGFHAHPDQPLVVYEFMPRGSLKSHLHGEKREPLAWSTRMDIAYDVANGLSYLHDEDPN